MFMRLACMRAHSFQDAWILIHGAEVGPATLIRISFVTLPESGFGSNAEAWPTIAGNEGGFPESTVQIARGCLHFAFLCKKTEDSKQEPAQTQPGNGMGGEHSLPEPSAQRHQHEAIFRSSEPYCCRK